MQYVTNVNIK